MKHNTSAAARLFAEVADRLIYSTVWHVCVRACVHLCVQDVQHDHVCNPLIMYPLAECDCYLVT